MICDVLFCKIKFVRGQRLNGEPKAVGLSSELQGACESGDLQQERGDQVAMNLGCWKREWHSVGKPEVSILCHWNLVPVWDWDHVRSGLQVQNCRLSFGFLHIGFRVRIDRTNPKVSFIYGRLLGDFASAIILTFNCY